MECPFCGKEMRASMDSLHFYCNSAYHDGAEIDIPYYLIIENGWKKDQTMDLEYDPWEEIDKGIEFKKKLKKLPGDQRNSYCLYTFIGWTFSEIGEHYGMDRETVRKSVELAEISLFGVKRPL